MRASLLDTTKTNRLACVAVVALLSPFAVASCSDDESRSDPLSQDIFGPKDAGQDIPKDPDDLDSDGYTPSTGDCNEYNALVNPGAFEYVGNEVDDDCDGTVDNGYADCDSVATGNGIAATAAAQAINLCSGKFLASADYEFSGEEIQRAVRSDFGPNISPRVGSTMLVMSTGKAIVPGENGFVETDPGTDHERSVTRPFSYASKPECPATDKASVQDPADLRLQLLAPTNAKSFSFDFRFMTAEYPEYYCSVFNDGFAAMVKSSSYTKRKNVAYGSQGEFISVNVSFWSICEDIADYSGCSESPATVDGSGFGSDAATPHGATRWLSTTVPVQPGETIELQLAVWDEGDGILDSTVIIDNFRWDINPAEKESTQEVK